MQLASGRIRPTLLGKDSETWPCNHCSISISSLLCRSEGPDEPLPVLSVPGRRHVHLFFLCGQHPLPGPYLQAWPRDVVEVADKQLHCGYLQGFSALLGVSDHDHLRGEVRVRFSAPPGDVVDQNPHDGCHRLHHHSHDSYHLCDLSSQGTYTDVISTWRTLNSPMSSLLNRVFCCCCCFLYYYYYYYYFIFLFYFIFVPDTICSFLRVKKKRDNFPSDTRMSHINGTNSLHNGISYFG